MLKIQTLPYVVVSHICSFLQWQEKLCALQAIPEWEFHIHNCEAWKYLAYREVAHRAQQERDELSGCLDKYGRYITGIHLSFRYALGRKGTTILKNIASHCSQLKSLEVVGTIWDHPAGQWFINVLNSCPKIKDLSIVRPSLVWGTADGGKDSLIIPLVKNGHSHKVTQLVLGSDSLVDHEGPLNLLTQFTNLHNLRIRREELSEEILLNLSKKHLCTLSLFQDEEMALGENAVYTSETWNKVIEAKPQFRLSLILRNIIVLRSLFPATAPIRALVLVDLSASLTKGILDTITQHYHRSLEIFVYTKSCVIGCAEMEDRRLPIALTDLVQHCKNLHTLVYGFEISSTTTLLIAQRRKLENFAVLVDQMSLEYDWTTRPEWSPQFVSWLRSSGSTMDTLEREVSQLLGYEWKVITESNMWRVVEYFINI